MLERCRHRETDLERRALTMANLLEPLLILRWAWWFSCCVSGADANYWGINRQLVR